MPSSSSIRPCRDRNRRRDLIRRRKTPGEDFDIGLISHHGHPVVRRDAVTVCFAVCKHVDLHDVRSGGGLVSTPKDILVASSAVSRESAGWVAVEIEFSTAVDSLVTVIELLALRVHNVEVEIDQGLPMEIDLDVTTADGDDVKGHLQNRPQGDAVGGIDAIIDAKARVKLPPGAS